MSKHMQLTVDVRPYYQETLQAVYPKLVANLSSSKALEPDEEPSIYDLVGNLDKLLYALDGNPACKEILLKHKDQLKKLHADIAGYIADWKLAPADQALYKLEDIFDDIEWELDKD
jgi:hypothetical protein